MSYFQQFARRTPLLLGFASVSAGVGAFGLRSLARPAMAEEEDAFSPKEFRPFTLREKIPLSHNTAVYRFNLPEDKKSGMFVASCLVTRADINGKSVIRPYTPVNDPEARGYFDLLVKVYPEGNMSKHIDNLKPGDALDVKGPITKINYVPNMKKNIGMIAGGTGITPMLQVIHAVVKNKEDKTNVSLVFANISEGDILLRKELDDLAAAHPNFKVHYVLEKPPAGWTQGTGYVNSNTIATYMPAPSDDNMVFVCGPPGMMEAVSGGKAPDYSQGELKGLLAAAGFTASQVFKF
eukprot:TRINITY_DN15785_c0_g1_i1.p1 TRINITY_DN15785_c0_g1~~TRINITY_DN15785_c0_g1_i1.p1  ORF type:complete len:294 (-),score=78.54 TRINITY_DN15785_c0_g1_i1:200-1081(-)